MSFQCCNANCFYVNEKLIIHFYEKILMVNISINITKCLFKNFPAYLVCMSVLPAFAIFMEYPWKLQIPYEWISK